MEKDLNVRYFYRAPSLLLTLLIAVGVGALIWLIWGGVQGAIIGVVVAIVVMLAAGR